ncbi:MAG: sugar ABC transporter permease [Deltaproteobacteria bacterium]|nr:sugar ABC transporter permease [Deltaproteobacteria bacterium]
MRFFRSHAALLFLLPALAGILIFIIYPIVYSFYISFFDWDMISDKKTFVGFGRYEHLLGDPKFIQVIVNTVVYMFSMVAVTVALALFLAAWLNKSRLVHNLAQTAIFTPHIISTISVVLLWMWVMNPDIGLLNYVMEKMGVDRLLALFGIKKMMWLESRTTALFSFIVIGVWKTLGYNTLVLLAGMQSIPKQIYEGAALDKASSLMKFYKITVPLLSPSLFFLLIVNVTSSFQTFESVNVISKGGPLNSTNMMVHWIYQTGFEFYRISDSSVGSVLLLLIIGLATYSNFRLLSSKVHYQ